MMRAIRLLNLRRLKRIRLRLLIAVVAVAAGSSLALSVFVVNASAKYSLNQLSLQVAGPAGLRIVGATSTGGIDFQALTAAATTPGVKTVIPVVEAVTVVRTASGHHQTVLLLGINCGGGGLVGHVSCASQSPSLQVAPSLARRLSSTSWLETNQGIDSLADVTTVKSLNTVDRGDVVVMPLSQAQQQFNRQGRIDDIYVVPASGVSAATLQHRLSKAIGPWDGVVSATAIPASVSLAISSFTPILGLLALLASAIAVVLVYNVISLTLEERRRERAIVAAVGAPPSVLIIGPLIEAAVLGAIGGVLGALGGIGLAHPIVGTLSHLTVNIAGVPITVHTSSSTYITGLIIGAVIGMLAAARPIQKAMRSDIAAEISNREQRERTSTMATLRRALIFTFLAVVGVVVSWLGERNGSLQQWQPLAALAGFLMAAIFATLASGSWAPVMIRYAIRTGRFKSGVTRLGLANLVREPGRTAVMAVAIGAAIGVAFITSSFNQAIDQDIATGLAQSSQAHSVLVTTYASAEGDNADGQLPASVIRALAAVPGVRRVDSFGGELSGHKVGQLTFVETESRPEFNAVLYAGTESPERFAQGQVLIGANLARRDRIHPGGELRLDTPSGVASVKVQGIWNNGNAGGDNVYVSEALQHRLFGNQQPLEVALEVDRAVSPSRVVAAVKGEHLGQYLKFFTPSQQLSSSDKGISGQLAPFQVLQRALLLVSFISVLSTLLLAGIQRRREFGLLGAVGMMPGELFRMVISEALAVGVVALIQGALLGMLLLFALLNVTPLLVGYHDTFSPDFPSLLVYGPVAIFVAVLASLWPGREAARTPILEALQYE
jgi:putative ABC transport system permease protein